MRFLTLLLLFLFSVSSFAVGIKEFPENKIRFGNGAGARELVFDEVPDGSSSKITNDPSTDQLTINNKLNLSEFDVSSTTKPSKPCPDMTETQRDAIASPGNGRCVYNTTKKKWNVYDTVSSQWKVAGSGGGGAGETITLNESFEDGTASWTLTNGTAASESSIVAHLEKSFKASLSAAALELYQDSTLHQAQFADNIEGITYARVKTTVSNIYVCRRQAGVLIANSNGSYITNCKLVRNNGKWGYYEIPTVFAGTSNGIAIVSLDPLDATAEPVSGDVYVDDTFVGMMSVKINLPGARKVGSIKFTGCSSNFSSASVSYIGMGTNTGCTITTTGEVSAPATMVSGFRLLNRLPGDYVFEAYGDFNKFTTTTNSLVGFKFVDTTSTIGSYDNMINHTSAAGAQVSVPRIGGALSYTTSAASTSYEIYGKTSTTASSTAAGIMVTSTNTLVIDVYHYPLASATGYSSQDADFDWEPCTGAGSWSANTTYACRKKRVGDELLLDYLVSTSGAPTATSLNVTLPDGLVIDTTKLAAGATVGASLEGVATANDSGGMYLLTPKYVNTTNVTASIAYDMTGSTTNYIQTINSVTNIAPFSFGSGDFVQIKVKVPILGWKGSNGIIGSFNEIPTNLGSNGADIQSVHFGSGASCGSNCTTGTCTICGQTGNKITSVTFSTTGQYNINGIDGLKYDCVGNAYQSAVGGSSLVHIESGSTTSLAKMYNWVSGGTQNAGDAHVFCFGIP